MVAVAAYSTCVQHVAVIKLCCATIPVLLHASSVTAAQYRHRYSDAPLSYLWNLGVFFPISLSLLSDDYDYGERHIICYDFLEFSGMWKLK